MSRTKDADGKDDQIAQMISDGIGILVIKDKLRVSSKRIARVRRERRLPNRRGRGAVMLVPPEPAVVDAAVEAVETIGAAPDETITITLREYELLDLCANLAHDNMRLRNLANKD